MPALARTGQGRVHETGRTGGGVEVQWQLTCPLPGKGFRHDLAPLGNSARQAQVMGQKYKGAVNLLIRHDFCGIFGTLKASASHCGTLTYRQKLLAKRKPCGEIAAMQQIKVRNGGCRCGSNWNEPIGPLTQSGHGDRRAEASSQDVLGFGVAIGLIRFVRSASIRG